VFLLFIFILPRNSHSDLIHCIGIAFLQRIFNVQFGNRWMILSCTQGLCYLMGLSLKQIHYDILHRCSFFEYLRASWVRLWFRMTLWLGLGLFLRMISFGMRFFPFLFFFLLLFLFIFLLLLLLRRFYCFPFTLKLFLFLYSILTNMSFLGYFGFLLGVRCRTSSRCARLEFTLTSWVAQ